MAARNPYGSWGPSGNQYRRRHLSPRLWWHGHRAQNRPRPQTNGRTSAVWGTSCEAKCQQGEVPCSQSDLHGPYDHYRWPSAQPSHRSSSGYHAHYKKSKQAVRRFLGAINYLSKFCPQLSSVTQPLRDLTKEDISFLRSTKHQHAFDEAKTLATAAPCLAYYDVTAPVVLQVDVSDYGLGAALLKPGTQQSDGTFDDSSLQPIAYSSKSLNPQNSDTLKSRRNALRSLKLLTNLTSGSLEKPTSLYTLTINPFNRSFKRTLLQHQNGCKRWCFSYSASTSLWCTEKILHYI